MKIFLDHRLTVPQLSLISEIENFDTTFVSTKISLATIEHLKKSTIVTSSGASTRIEGALLSDQEIEALIAKGCQITKMSSRSEREVAGYIKALNYISSHYQDLSISEKTIREIHSLLTKELTSTQLPLSQRGNYKNISNDVVETDIETKQVLKVWFKTTPPGPYTQIAMKNLIDDYQTIYSKKLCSPLIIIAGFIVHFLAIHPFRDGNGRLSRLLNNSFTFKTRLFLAALQFP